MLDQSAVTIDRRDFDAAVFDLDGVLTDTARIHAAAWKAVFDAFLQQRAQRQGLPFEPFDTVADYRAYVDGRPRSDGVRSFLAARSIHLPEGTEHDPPEADTIRALGERKLRLFRQELQRGIAPAPGAADLLKRLRAAGIGVAVASSSKNCAAVLQVAGLADLVDVRADGLDVEALRLPGKPDPALFLEAARRLGVPPSRAILFEDALAGVEAGRRGGFGCVVGIDRGQQADALRRRGADVVIGSLREVRVVKD
jgi:beta-phosphoglucomutase family hydrolase